MTRRISESSQSAQAAEPQVDQQPALVVRPAQWWRQRRLDHEAQETIETSLPSQTRPYVLRRGSGRSNRTHQRQYILYWQAFSPSTLNAPPGWVWRVVYARHRATGEVQRLRMLRRIGDGLPPDSPEPPNPPTLPADARGWRDAAALRSFDEVRAA